MTPINNGQTGFLGTK